MILSWVHLNLLYLQKSTHASPRKFLTVSGVAGIIILGDFLIWKGCILWTFFFVLLFELCCRRGKSG